ncbi:MAG: hypothetical protein H6Q71_36 [Firmicutes bacterium]|nr:hypothetical protein [Bacillota bacterium]
MASIENQAMETTPKDRKISRAQRLRERLSETANEDSMIGMEQIFEAKLAAVNTYEKQLASVTDPYARKTLQRMIRQERKELLGLAELIDLVENSPDMGALARSRRRFNHQIKTTTGRDASFWLGAAAVGALLLPGVREQIRPLAVKTVQGVIALSDQVKGLFSGVKEDIEDLVSEAQFEKFKQSIDSGILEESMENEATTETGAPLEPEHE